MNREFNRFELHPEKLYGRGKRNRITRFVFILFTLSIFLKNIAFHYFIFFSLPISSIWHNPYHASLFYFAKLVPALVLASFVFLSKRYWWTILVSILSDIWIMSNVFYFRANNLFINVEAMRMAGNLAGFEDSIFALFSPVILISIAITIIYTIILFVFAKKKQNNRGWKSFCICICISFLLIIYNNFPIWKAWYADNQEEVAFDPDGYGGSKGLKFFYPFYQVYFIAGLTFSSSDWTVDYVRRQSIISYFAAIFVYETGLDKQKVLSSLPDKTLHEISLLVQPKQKQNEQKVNLIIFLVESLESWPLENAMLRETVLPNISKLMSEKSAFFCEHINSQVKHGVSSDGQLLINTGMMPVQNGAACFLYGDNIYPNLAHFFAKSYTVNCSPGTWNQTQMSKAYGYTDLIEDKNGEHWSDKEVIDNGLIYAMKSEEPFMMQMITVASHFPFTSFRNRLELDVKMPEIMRNYLNCLNYTDECIGNFLDNYLASERASRTVFVITGDHTVFKSGMIHDFQPYAELHNLSLASGNTYVPLLIIKPEESFAENYKENAYQMDIFPTILSAIGQDNYYWKGFGIDLYKEKTKRLILPEKAFELSDQMIRNNYFAK